MIFLAVSSVFSVVPVVSNINGTKPEEEAAVGGVRSVKRCGIIPADDVGEEGAGVEEDVESTIGEDGACVVDVAGSSVGDDGDGVGVDDIEVAGCDEAGGVPQIQVQPGVG